MQKLKLVIWVAMMSATVGQIERANGEATWMVTTGWDEIYYEGMKQWSLDYDVQQTTAAEHFHSTCGSTAACGYACGWVDAQAFWDGRYTEWVGGESGTVDEQTNTSGWAYALGTRDRDFRLIAPGSADCSPFHVARLSSVDWSVSGDVGNWDVTTGTATFHAEAFGVTSLSTGEDASVVVTVNKVVEEMAWWVPSGIELQIGAEAPVNVTWDDISGIFDDTFSEQGSQIAPLIATKQVNFIVTEYGYVDIQSCQAASNAVQASVGVIAGSGYTEADDGYYSDHFAGYP